MACGEPATVSEVVLEVVTTLATAATRMQLAVCVPSALNLTLPSLLGLPAPAPVPITFPYTTLFRSKLEGFTLELTAVDVVRLLTVWPPVRVPVLSAKLLPLA